MFTRFEEAIKKADLAQKNDKIIVGLSGGADSVALAFLLQHYGAKVHAAHCNYGLRGSESDEDEAFVRSFAAQHQIELHVKRFDTASYVEKNQVSIQIAARDLRYEWFEQLRQQLHCSAIAVAHHADDQLETFFINLIRTSGIGGLKAMKLKNGLIIRPLLSFRRSEIEFFLKSQGILWRNDSSNAETHYLRNKIRHWVIPAFSRIDEGTIDGMLNSISLLQQDALLLEALVQKESQHLIIQSDTDWRIAKDRWMEKEGAEALLFGLVGRFGFKGQAVKAILLAVKRQPGAVFFSPTHRLSIAHNHLIIEEIQKNKDEEATLIQADSRLIEKPLKLRLQTEEAGPHIRLAQPPTIAQLDFDCLKFPLIIRKIKNGDRFQPYGMKGSRLLSNFLTDRHLSRAERERMWVLVDASDRIVWIPGLRINGIFAVTAQTEKIWRAELLS